jgi:hypothetical protein
VVAFNGAKCSCSLDARAVHGFCSFDSRAFGPVTVKIIYCLENEDKEGKHFHFLNIHNTVLNLKREGDLRENISRFKIRFR